MRRHTICVGFIDDHSETGDVITKKTYSEISHYKTDCTEIWNSYPFHAYFRLNRDAATLMSFQWSILWSFSGSNKKFQSFEVWAWKGPDFSQSFLQQYKNYSNVKLKLITTLNCAFVMNYFVCWRGTSSHRKNLWSKTLIVWSKLGFWNHFPIYLESCSFECSCNLIDDLDCNYPALICLATKSCEVFSLVDKLVSKHDFARSSWLSNPFYVISYSWALLWYLHIWTLLQCFFMNRASYLTIWI